MPSVNPVTWYHPGHCWRKKESGAGSRRQRLHRQLGLEGRAILDNFLPRLFVPAPYPKIKVNPGSRIKHRCAQLGEHRHRDHSFEAGG
eukprot:3126853-Rhodomonas_salina.1